MSTHNDEVLQMSTYNGEVLLMSTHNGDMLLMSTHNNEVLLISTHNSTHSICFFYGLSIKKNNICCGYSLLCF